MIGANAEFGPLAPLAVTMGEPSGIGGEIAVRAWRMLKASGPPFFLIDDPARIAALGAPVTEIARPREARLAFDARLPVLPLEMSVAAEPGIPDPANAAAVIASIERAVRFALAGEASGVVTNPIQKSTLLAAGFAFVGHTEFLAALTADAAAAPRRGPVMMLAGPKLRTVPATVHRPLASVPAALSVDLLVSIGEVTAEALRRDFGLQKPRLAFSGLNPHAGENGNLGREEHDVIVPAIAALRASGILVRGPDAADSMFTPAARAGYDAAICMYHDQALIPIKTLHFDDAVNVTLGLPIVRTSPDHGTALDIAGTDAARADSLIAAIRLAASIAERRRAAA